MLDLAPHGNRFTDLTPIPGASPAAFRAIDTYLGRAVVIKAVPRLSLADSTQALLFQRGASVASKLDSPHIPRVYDRFTSPTHYVLVQEDAEYVTLEQELKEAAGGRVSVARAFAIAAEVAEALVVAHRHGVVHRNLGPASVALTHVGGTVKLGGFEVAVLPLDQPDAPDPWAKDPWLGHPHYTAPEQGDGGRPDARSDVFSLGVLLYRMLTGNMPFTGGNPTAIQWDKEHTDPPAPSKGRKDVPAAADQLVRRLLAKKPGKRPESMAEALTELRKVAAPVPVPEQDRRNDILLHYPTPIAKAYAQVWREPDWAVRREGLFQLVETTLKYCTVSAVLAACEVRGCDPPTVLDGISRPMFGTWMRHLREAVQLPRGSSPFIDRMRESLFTGAGGERGEEFINATLKARNAQFHYHARRPRADEEGPFRELLPGVHALLTSLRWLTEYPLVHVIAMDWDKGTKRHLVRYRLCAGVVPTAGPEHVAALADGPGLDDMGLLNAGGERFLDLHPFVRYAPCQVCEEPDVFVYHGGTPKTTVQLMSCHGPHPWSDEHPHDPFEKRGLVWS